MRLLYGISTTIRLIAVRETGIISLYIYNFTIDSETYLFYFLFSNFLIWPCTQINRFEHLIVYIIFRLIRNQTEFRVVPNQSVNYKYNNI